MQQKLILENWRKFLKEELEGLAQTEQETEEKLKDTSTTKVQPTVQQQQQTIKDTILGNIQNTLTQARQTAESEGINKSDLQNAIITKVREIVKEEIEQQRNYDMPDSESESEDEDVDIDNL